MEKRKKEYWTLQRIAIYEFLKENYNHPTVEEVINYLKKKFEKVNKKTVYNNIHFLSKEKIIREISIEGKNYFEPYQKEHAHFICLNCKKIIDLDYSKTLNKIKKENEKDKEIYQINLIIKGLCSKCKKKIKK